MKAVKAAQIKYSKWHLDNSAAFSPNGKCPKECFQDIIDLNIIFNHQITQSVLFQL